MKILVSVLSMVVAFAGSMAQAASCKTADNLKWVTINVSQDRSQITLIYSRSVAFKGEKLAEANGVETFGEMQLLDPVTGRTRGGLPGVMIASVKTADKMYVDVQEDEHVTSFICGENR